MSISPSFSRTRFFRFFLFVVLLLQVINPGASHAAGVLELQIPAELQQWIPWVLHEQEEQTCSLETTGAIKRYCTWPSSLELDANGNGAAFRQEWVVETRSRVDLPGESPFWPEKVQVNGKSVLVTGDKGRPSVWLDPGRHNISGSFTWKELPEYLSIPPATGLVRLTLLGKKINNIQLDEQGKLWFKHKGSTQKPAEESLAIQVYRKIDDGVPLRQQLRILLIVSGSPREVTLGLELGEDFVPQQLHSPLPVRLDNSGRLHFQVRPGQWQIQLTLRNSRSLSPENIGQGKIHGSWPKEEIWVFAADPKLRQIEIQGVAPVDPSRTSLPQDWKNLPAYLLTSGDRMMLKEKNRGNPNPVPNRLQLKRKIWLDEKGSGVTVLDAIDGIMTRGWRLNVDPHLRLGKVDVEGNSRLITRLQGSDKIGVEVRQGSLSLRAESRIDKPVQGGRLTIPTLGWDHTFQQVSAELNLPPGWKLFTASGVDQVSTWLNRWTLLDIFLVLIIGLATAKILGLGWGSVAFFTLILTYHQPDSPRFLWLPLLGLLALQKISTAKTGERVSRVSALVVLVVIIVSSVPYMIQEVRTGLYPQLEYGPSYRISQGDLLQREMADQLPAVMEEEILERPSAAMLKSKAQPGEAGHYSVRSMPEQAKSIQVDPQDMIQTGPGLPNWHWQQIRLTWNGPVKPGQDITFIFISPLVNTVLSCIRVLLLALLIIGFLRQCLRVGKIQQGSTSATIVAVLFALLLPGSFIFLPSSVQATVPPPEILQELQQRLLAQPECGQNCAAINSCLIQVKNDQLQVHLNVDSRIKGAIPLPGKNRFFDHIILDDKPADILRRDSQGNSVIRLDPGSHRLILKKDLSSRGEVSFSFPLSPPRAEAVLQNWTINGLRDNGTIDKQVTLNRIQPLAVEKDNDEPDTDGVHIPAFVQIQRTLHMGLEWSVTTRVFRRSPETVIALDIPLLSGERVTTESLHIKDNRIRINMGPKQQVFSWQSAMEPVDKLTFTAPETSSWTEVWFLDVSPMWHVETQGLPEINQTDPAGKRYPEYQPYPGESLHLAISRPEGVSGPTMTITGSRMVVQPGRRVTEVSLFFSLTASRGLRHTITLPSGIDLQKTLINGKEYPLQLVNNQLIIPLRPGKQDVEIGWRSERGVETKLVTRTVDLGIESVNASIELMVPASRWILLAGGPSIGPAVLFWGELLVIILFALLLGRIKFTPLSTLQWLLLSLGLSQIPSPLAATVVAWLLLLGLRKSRGGEIKRAATFNSMQILLVVLTFTALSALFYAIQQGLLGHPDMQIGGNGSSGHMLRWYQDRTGSQLPAGWVVTVPLMVYRISMLLWALWLAIALLKWLRWGWECFSSTTTWIKPAPKKKAPAAVRTAKGRSSAKGTGTSEKQVEKITDVDPAD